jgi:tRNA(Ile)-lysidine synthase
VKKERVVVVAVSGGPDSVYLLRRLVAEKAGRVVVGHVNHGARGRESDKDQEFVEKIAGELRLEHRIGKATKGKSSLRPAVPTKDGGGATFPAGFEGKARTVRYEFLKALAAETGAGKIALAHTADDQVETILMRVFEGAGIGGLKGIPRKSDDGIVRPILDVWKEDILEYLKKHKNLYRTDRSNFDTRFERNWVRHVLIPLLEKRYGKSIRKRIFTLGERFREIDDYLDAEARTWIRRNVPPPGSGLGSITLKRAPFSALPPVLRIRILQKIGYERLALAPNERLLTAMDRTIRDGGPSARVKVGKGWELANRYGLALFIHGKPVRGKTGGNSVSVDPEGGGDGFVMEAKGKVTPAQAKRVAAKGNAELFDAAGLKLPLAVRPLRAGDRIRPFGLSSDKKVKEILIDRKIPREARWGRPAVCDADGAILWIPGVIRSAHAPVTAATRKTALLKMSPPK